MSFSQIQGNAEVKAALAGMIDSGKIPHAIMFHEDDGGGAMLFVQAFLKYLYCKNRSGGDCCGSCPGCNKITKLIHPDVHYIFPVNSGRSVDYVAAFRKLVQTNPCFTEGELGEALETEGKTSLIKVDEAKALLEILSLSALERGYRSVVIYLPEKMNKETSNRLLKVIEEPPELTQFLFITHSPETVLPTISSRCQRIRILPQGSSGDSARVLLEDEQLVRQLMQTLLSRDLGSVLEVGETLAALPSRERARAFCRYLTERLRLVFLLQQGLGDMVNVPQEERALLEDWAKRAKPTFPRTALDLIGRSLGYIERNVSIKILFTDLVDRLYMSI